MHINRGNDINSKCWCGSGRSYGTCHYEFDKKIQYLRSKGKITPLKRMIKNSAMIEGIKKAAEINSGLLDLVEKEIHQGMSTEDINKMVHEYTVSHGAVPADLNYEGFPKSVCISINDEVCHGIPSSERILKDGDIVNVDATTNLNGYFADASRMFLIGNVSEENKKLVSVAKECLEKAVSIIRPFETTLGDIGAVISEHARNNHFTVVREFCGHGVGLAIHEDPTVLHYGKRGLGMILVPGMVFTIEPMINAGERKVYIDRKNGWTVKTKDKSYSAQWEHTLLVTDDGVEIISK
ncbi:type I methionyl aminopeptidase [uncultured Clostridium sp.]|uniref:type I methionyl aminopeptidase n=1 Tax=uncultured Clostridium sp. TaxID=59620 RepID=UPI0025E06B8E|nr:type I methionyl aminopeptidase [uncultured Clostridium sp.]